MMLDVQPRTARVEHYEAALDAAQELADLGGLVFRLGDPHYRVTGLLRRACGVSHIALHECAHELAIISHPDDAAEAVRLLDTLERFDPYEGEIRIRVDGEYRRFLLRTTVVRAPESYPTGVIGIAQDITERVRERTRLSVAAFRDATTGLPNRLALFEPHEPASRDASAMIVARLRWVAAASDRCQAVRERLAQAMVTTIARAVPCGSTIVRYGEESFAAALYEACEAATAVQVAASIVEALQRPVAIDGDEFIVLPAIGVAVADGGVCGVAELARRAESAAHEAQRHELPLVMYTEQLEERCNRRAAIARHLRHAVSENRLHVEYQPVISLQSGRIVAAEALLRWKCPGLGSVPPDEFIAVAEDTGAIVPLGEWVLREACAQAVRWQSAGGEGVRVMVNVSARQVAERGFVPLVRAVCRESGLAPALLELEITERVMTDPDSPALRNLRALRESGIRVAVDDFGTGYSALSYLASLPLDTLKLDRAFVAPIAEDDFKAEIARSMIALAQRRRLTVVGEGVETPEQAAQLRAMGCDEAQGYHFARSLPADDFAALLPARRVATR